jgi:DNA (cytosine-5)-methyltransferase 1
MRLLDLFCGAGGAGMGYHRAGFEVVGVDIRPMPRYPFECHQADALEYLAEHGREFDAIHASPPCQRYSVGTPDRSKHPDLIPQTRAALQKNGRPWVIENVLHAPMRGDIRLCGCMVGLPKIKRVRNFETSWRAFVILPPCHHDGPVITVTGHGTTSGNRETWGRNIRVWEMREAMGIDWMNRDELSLAIPPNYTEFIGRQLMQYLEVQHDPV